MGATTISLFAERFTLGNTSYTFSGDLNGDGQTQNDLIYVPRNATDANEIVFGGTNPQAQAQAFEQFISAITLAAASASRDKDPASGFAKELSLAVDGALVGIGTAFPPAALVMAVLGVAKSALTLGVDLKRERDRVEKDDRKNVEAREAEHIVWFVVGHVSNGISILLPAA